MPDEKGPRLPGANEFSPGQVDLMRVLEIANSHPGDRAALDEAMRSEYFKNAAPKRLDPVERLEQQLGRARNVFIGMSQYGLFNLTTNELTDLGKTLRGLSTDIDRYNTLAKDVLLNRYGKDVLEAVQHLREKNPGARNPATKLALDRELELAGFDMQSTTTNHLIILKWLRCASVVDKNNNIDDAVVRGLIGTGISTVLEWAYLTPQQKAFLRTMREAAEVHGTDPVSTKAIKDRSEAEHGEIFSAINDRMRDMVYRPLESDGWITTSGVGPGRGGNSGKVAATSKLLAVRLELMTGDAEWGIPSKVRRLLNTPLSKIYTDLAPSKDKHAKGLALELLAVRMAVDLGLTPLRFRLHSVETGYAEVDLVAEGAHLHFSRWLFQCKNTKEVDLAALAKEVGMAVLMRAHVIVMVTTGRFRATVAEHAKELADTTHLQAVLFDGRALRQYRDGDAVALLEFFHARAHDTLKLKRPQIARVEQA